MYYTQEQIDHANQADLVSFLQSQGEQLTRAGNEYRWKRHDSLTVRGNKWYRHSQSKGGGPVDFLMEFFGKSFTEAVELLTGEKGAAPPPDSPAPLSDFRLPPRSPTAEQVKRYLTEARRIDEDVTGFFISSGDIYEEAAHHNAVFVGRDESGIPRYAHQRGTAGSFRLDVKGSDKAFNFCYRGEGERLFVFEAPIDLLSFLCLFKKEWQKQSYLALGGVGEKALLRFLSDRPNIKTVYLCLDSDQAGNDACSRLVELMPEGKPVAFCLDPETGFEWIGEYDITADELLSGAGGNNATKTEQAEKLILDLLADGKELASGDIEKAAADAGISARTVRAAKKNLDGRITSKRIGAAWYHALKK